VCALAAKTGGESFFSLVSSRLVACPVGPSFPKSASRVLEPFLGRILLDLTVYALLKVMVLGAWLNPNCRRAATQVIG